MSAISLTIDGLEVEVTPGTTILEAARKLGIDIPTFCHDPELLPNGACRICVVEVEKARALVASCVAPVGPGMVVYTESERVVNARKAVLSLQLANHPLDCITCEKTGDCKLQDYCYRYGVATSEYVGEIKDLPYDDTNVFFRRDMNKCILCGICVGKCQDVVGAGAIDFSKRGFVTNVSPAFEDSIEESSCVFCGMCIDNCPVGALIPKYGIGLGRPWQVTLVKAICPYCSVGCNINLHVNNDQLIGVSGVESSPVNRGHLCARGKFGLDFIHSGERLTAPLIKSDGVFIEVSWEEALEYLIDNFKDVLKRHGADSFYGLGSPKLSNEDNYLFQKLIRSLGTNNVDSYSHYCHASSVDGLMEAFGSAAMTNSIDEISTTEAVLVIGANLAESHPILEYRIREAIQKGAQLVVADSEMVSLSDVAHYYLPLKQGTAVALANGLANIIISEDLLDKAFVEKRTEGYDELKKAVAQYSPEQVSAITGIPEMDLRAAASAFASADKAIVVSTADQHNHRDGKALVAALANLVMLTGNIGKESTGLYLPYGENNLQGSADMGVLPGMLTGYQPLENKEVRDKFSKLWGVSISEKPGISAQEVFAGSGRNDLKAMYIMGEDPVACAINPADVRTVLNDLDFLVVQDIFMTETASLADVVLPAASFAEKMGTYTNTERRVQLSHPAVEAPGEAFPDWAIISEIADWFGLDWEYSGPEDVFTEIAELTPDYAGINYLRLAEQGIQWPCPDQNHPGTKYLYEKQFNRGKGIFSPVDYVAVDTGTDVAVCCTAGQYNCQCQSQNMSSHSIISALAHKCCT